MKRSWRETQAWHLRWQERSLLMVQHQLQFKVQDWMGHEKKLRLGTTRKSCECLLMKVQSSFSWRPQWFVETSIIWWPAITSVTVGWSDLECRRQVVCAAERIERKMTQEALWRSLGNHGWTPDTEWLKLCNYLRCQRFQSHGIPAKESCKVGVNPSCGKELCGSQKVL